MGKPGLKHRVYLVHIRLHTEETIISSLWFFNVESESGRLFGECDVGVRADSMRGYCCIYCSLCCSRSPNSVATQMLLAAGNSHLTPYTRTRKSVQVVAYHVEQIAATAMYSSSRVAVAAASCTMSNLKHEGAMSNLKFTMSLV